MLRRRLQPLLPLFLVASLIVGCSLFEDGGGEPTPEPSATSEAPAGSGPEEPGPAPSEPDPPGTVYAAEWVVGEPPAAPDFTEIEAPFEEFLPHGNAVWRLYVVDGDAEPRLVQETGRWLGSPRWDPSDDSLTLRYLTRVEEADSFIPGYERLAAATGAAIWDFLVDVPSNLSLRPDGTRFAGKERSGRPYNRAPLYVMEPGGKTLTLDGFTAEDIREWSPDGRFLVVAGYAGDVTTPREPSRNYYLVEPGNNETVLFLGRPGVNESLSVAWSPDGSRAAYMLGEALMLYDIESQLLQTVSLTIHTNDEPAWSANGRYLVIKDGVVDVDGGSVVLAPSPEPPAGQGDPVYQASVSDDGSMLAWAESIFTSDCEGLQSTRVWLKDVATGEDRVLLDCGDQVYIDVEWIDARHLIVRSADCNQCEPRYFGLKLFSFPDGSSLDLTNGQEDGATYAVSPDRSRILVGGGELRLYDAAGGLLRVIEIPNAHKVTGLSWSHDGSSFAYVVGPAEAFLP